MSPTKLVSQRADGGPDEGEEAPVEGTSPQPQTYRHVSPMKTTSTQLAAQKDHEILKRCKSTSKNMSMNKSGHLRQTQVKSIGQKQALLKNRDVHNMSVS